MQENKTMKIPIDENLINEILKYLSKKPFAEVNMLINGLILEGKEFQQESQGELDIDAAD